MYLVACLSYLLVLARLGVLADLLQGSHQYGLHVCCGDGVGDGGDGGVSLPTPSATLAIATAARTSVLLRAVFFSPQHSL